MIPDSVQRRSEGLGFLAGISIALKEYRWKKLAKGFGKLLTTEALVPKHTGFEPFYFGSFNVAKKYADAHPDVVKKICMALDESIAFINSKPTEAKSYMAKYIDPSLSPLNEKYPDALYYTCNKVGNSELEKMFQHYLDMKIIAESLDLTNAQYQPGK